MIAARALAPFDAVNLLLNLDRLQVVEFRLVRLEFRVKLVLAAAFLHILIRIKLI